MITYYDDRKVRVTSDAIRVAGRPPGNASDWQHVRGYVEYHGMIVNLAARWRTLADHIHAEVCEKAFDPELGCFVQAYGSKALDASLLHLGPDK